MKKPTLTAADLSLLLNAVSTKAEGIQHLPTLDKLLALQQKLLRLQDAAQLADFKRTPAGKVWLAGIEARRVKGIVAQLHADVAAAQVSK